MNTFRINHESPDYESIANYMSQFGSGLISIKKNYWNEGIALLEIDNEGKRNAISGKMMVDLKNCLSDLEKWKEGKAMILYGSGKNFCAGGDLDFARAHSTEYDAFCLSALMMNNLFRLRNLPLITISLIHGPTIGGGAEIAVQSDFILASDDVRFGFVHGNMGISTAWGGTTRMVQLLGQRVALEILLTSKVFDANELESIGLASKILESSDRMPEALEWARQRIKHDVEVVRNFKKITTMTIEKSYEESLKIEREIFCPLWGGVANKKALDKHIKHVKS